MFETNTKPSYYRSDANHFNTLEVASLATSAANDHVHGSAHDESMSENNSQTIGTSIRTLKLRRKNKLESKLEVTRVTEPQEMVDEKMIVDDFFAYQLSEQREQEARRNEYFAKEASRNPISAKEQALYEDKCTECDHLNTLVYKNAEGTKVCRRCGVVNQISVIDQTLEKNCYEGDDPNAQRAGPANSNQCFQI